MPLMMNGVKTIAPTSRSSVVFAIHLMIASLACWKGSDYFFKEIASNQTTPKPIKLILIGQTGAGKSTFGNTLLGKDVFEVGHTIDSCTIEASVESGNLFEMGRDIIISDTVGSSDSSLIGAKDDSEVFADNIADIIRSVDGVHGIIYVINACDQRFNSHAGKALSILTQTFTDEDKREELAKRLSFVFTQCTDFQNRVKWEVLPTKVCDRVNVCNTITHWYDHSGQSDQRSLVHHLIWGITPNAIRWIKHIFFASWEDKFVDWLNQLPAESFMVPSVAERASLMNKYHKCCDDSQDSYVSWTFDMLKAPARITSSLWSSHYPSFSISLYSLASLPLTICNKMMMMISFGSFNMTSSTT